MGARKRKVVFVLGAPRSGTSIVWLALKNALDATHYGESHMMPFFASLAEKIQEDFLRLPARENAGTLAANTNPTAIDKHFLKMVRRFYMEAYDGSHIVDKTPSLNAVVSIPFTKRAFPSAYFVFCHRRGLENVESRLRKWPDKSFESHCFWWNEIMSTWRSIRNDLSDEDYREVDQQVIVNRPDEVASSLAGMIGLTLKETTLVLKTFRTRDASMIDGSNKRKILSLDCLGWDPDQKRMFMDICGEELRAWSYTLDETYREPLAVSPVSVSY